MEQTIYNNRQASLNIRMSQAPDKAHMDLLRHTVWGTHGSCYQDKNMFERLHSMQNPLFMSLAKHGQVIGGYCFSQRDLPCGHVSVPAVLRTSLCVRQDYMNKGYGRLLVETARDYFQRLQGPQRFSYGFVEEQNVRSLRILEDVGYQTIGTFEPVVVSRLYPKSLDKVDYANSAELPLVRRWLGRQYPEHALLDLATVGVHENYFVLRHGADIVCGLQVLPSTVCVKKLEGAWMSLFTRPLFSLPFNHSFVGNEYRYLAADAMFVRPGYEDWLHRLFESLMHRFRVNFAVSFLDRQSPLYPLLRHSKKSGFINRCFRPRPIHIVGETGFDFKAPFYIRASDVH